MLKLELLCGAYLDNTLKDRFLWLNEVKVENDSICCDYETNENKSDVYKVDKLDLIYFALIHEYIDLCGL